MASSTLQPERVIDRLTLINRAYNAHYAMGGKSSDNLTDAEMMAYVRGAQRIMAGNPLTSWENQLEQALNPSMLRYVATGVMR